MSTLESDLQTERWEKGLGKGKKSWAVVVPEDRGREGGEEEGRWKNSEERAIISVDVRTSSWFEGRVKR